MLLNDNSLRTCEQVRAGHPDKLCDRIGDELLDLILGDESNLAEAKSIRAGIEVLAKGDAIVLAGEIRSEIASSVDFEGVVRSIVSDLGYEYSSRLQLINLIGEQQPELQASSDRRGAGDQGIMVGYACRDTPTLMPLEFSYVTQICRKLDDAMASPGYEWLLPDGKAQVTLGADSSVKKVVIGVQHSPEVHGLTDGAAIQRVLTEQIREEFLPHVLGDAAAGAEILVNGTGSFSIGGPAGDTGVLGRKVVCDAYGPRVPVGGGAFSGKDPTKVDRSAAYIARLIAREAIVQGVTNASEVVVQIAFSIGEHQPTMLVARGDDGSDLSRWVHDAFPDLSPVAIADRLGLWDPTASHWRYRDTAAYGHFGRDEFPWESMKADRKVAA